MDWLPICSSVPASAARTWTWTATPRSGNTTSPRMVRSPTPSSTVAQTRGRCMDLHSRLTSVFRDVFDDDDLQISAATTADDIDAWTSLAHINLMMRIEDTFG